MTHRSAPLVVALLFSAAALAEPGATAGYARDEVRGVIEHQVASWNKKNLEGFCAPYADNATFLTPKGVTRGRAKILARYQKSYVEEKGDMGTLSLDVLELRPSADQRFATVALKWTLKFTKRKDKVKEASGYSLIALEKRDSGWVIVQDASM